jgi:hypothetical protein
MENVSKASQKFLSYALSVKVSPRLANLGERRQLLAKLKEYGDVLVFKSLYVRTHPPAAVRYIRLTVHVV